MSEVNQSDLAELKDQLFIDTADGKYLNNVTSNLGVFRPSFGINDDAEWRAIAKKIAFNPKQIPRIFRHVIECCIGPRCTRVANLSADSSVGDTLVYVNDASNLIQLGSMVIDAGLPTEETVRFEFVDLVNNTVLFETGLTYAHTALADASGIVVSDTPATSLSLALVDSSDFPTTGYPYPLLVGRGTAVEEMVLVYDNDTTTNTLTISALVNDQRGFTASFVRRPLLLETFAGRTFINLDVDDTRVFPASGWLRIGAGTIGAEVVEFHTNSVDEDALYLSSPLVNGHAAGVSVELVRPGAEVATAALSQTGIGWEILDSATRDLKIYIPESYRPLGILDATYLHDASPAAVSTTLADDVAVGDTVISLTSVAGMPDEAGLLLINGTHTVFYALRNEDDTPNPTVELLQPCAEAFSAGATVDLFSVPYGVTSLEDANVYDGAGNLVDNVFPGKYVFDPTQSSPSSVYTTLVGVIPPSTRVAYDQQAGYTNLEVVDASLWPAAPYTVRVGRDSGVQEDLTVTDVTLAASTSSTLAAPASASATSIVLVGSNDFPESSITNMAGYRVVIDRGNAGEEIVTVLHNDASTETLTVSPLANSHLVGVSVDLVNDTLTFSTGLDDDHPGTQVTPSALGHTVDKLTSLMPVLSVSGMSTSGSVIINYGNETIPARARITSAAAGLYSVPDSSIFPTTNFPYQVVLGQGLPTEEFVDVTANNTGANVLSTSAPVNTHLAGEYIEFRIESPEVVEYQDIDGSSLEFIPPVVLNKHVIGESVVVSNRSSLPDSDGYDYAFYLPPDRFVCLTYVFELIRAAGTQVTVVESR